MRDSTRLTLHTMLKRPTATAATMLKRPAIAQAVVRKRPAANVDDKVNGARKELCHLPSGWDWLEVPTTLRGD